MGTYLSSAFKEFQRYETLGRKTMEQLSDKDLFYQPGKEVNSIAVTVKHLHGNMMSRWTDFMTTDGEKEWRERDGEFEDSLKNREEIYQLWTEGWNLVFDALEKLREPQLENTVVIRGEEHSVIAATNRQLCHYAYHVGQMVLIGKMLKEEEWESLSIPRGKTKEYNERMKG
ncbi:MAG TPA: DUF1572 family protein [Cryomorphaceae bacterium]|nr:DUF1572 family protein [Cryomorphaceae bacterium]